MLAALLVAASLTTVETDARVELLGVVQLLAGKRAPLPIDAELESRVRRRFEPFKEHAAVKLYERACLRPAGDACGILVLYYSQPPELRLASAARLPYLDAESDKEAYQRFLWELRSFAKASGFAAFHREREKELAALAAAGRKELGDKDPLRVIQDYAGMSLEATNRYVLSPLYTPRHYVSFIIPYPDPATLPKPPPEGFAVHSLFSWVDASQRPVVIPGVPVFEPASPTLLHEPLFVLLDPGFWRYEAQAVKDPASFYKTGESCRRSDINCLKTYVVAGLVDRLGLRAWDRRRLPPDDGSEYARMTRAMSARLEEYEKDRERWPTLWDFFPRLYELLGGKGALPAASPARPKTVRELFPG